MESGSTASRFRTTSWTMVCQAGASREQLGELLSIYWSPIYAYLRRKGHDSATASDFTQGFLTRVVERGLLGRADPSRGRFRTFLLSCLDNFVRDQIRVETGRDGTRRIRLTGADPDALEAAEPRHSDGPPDAFNRQWATTVMAQAVDQMERTCRESGQGRYWTVFEGRELRRAHNCEPVPVEELVEAVGASKPADVHTLLYRARKMFRQVLRDVVAETVVNPAEVDDELAAIARYLKGG